MGDISSLEHWSQPYVYAHTHTHTDTHAVSGPAALPAADMKINAMVVWTCTLVVSLLMESCHPQKLNIHWGPQSMMYLKGKHGRRFVSDADNSVLKQGLHDWYAVLRGLYLLHSRDFHKPSRIVSAEKVLIHYLQER